MLLGLGARLQRRRHNALKDPPIQIASALRKSAVADVDSRKLVHVLCQSARSTQNVEDHSHDELMRAELVGPAFARTQLFEEARDKGDAQKLSEDVAEERCIDDGCMSHPEVIEQPGKKYQVCFLSGLDNIYQRPVNIDQTSLQNFQFLTGIGIKLKSES